MAGTQTRQLEDYLALEYPFEVHADPDGGYVVSFPDLPGCLTQVDSLAELPGAVEEARTLWLETAYEAGIDIALPSYPENCSGKILLRISKSLHRLLLYQARREGVSLNQYAATILARGDTAAAIERRLDQLERKLQRVDDI